LKILSGNHSIKFGDQALIMGILNVTPDSFSDGGSFFTAKPIAAQVDKLLGDGADIIDVGGESTRPFAEAITLEEELRRVIPAIREIRRRSGVLISIDTTKSQVARQAVENGADIINDISALRFDREMITVVRESNVPVIIMHNTPRDMQIEPKYGDVVAEVTGFLRERVEWAETHGLKRERIIIDPGIGFGKTVAHNLTLLKNIRSFTTLGSPVLVGHSRKAFIGRVLDLDVADRDLATAILSAHCVANGASLVRVHDVGKTRQAIRLMEAVLSAA
jgi:dihydropteroate synthase